MNQDLYIGLISGTSVDGVDAALVSFSGGRPELIAAHLQPYPVELRQAVLNLFQPDTNEIDRMGEVDNAVGELFAIAAQTLLQQAGLDPKSIRGIGSHGQTIRHRPKAAHPFTTQIGNPFVIAERTGIDIVWDFRRRDMAVGGQGAPLAPLFHQAFIGHPDEYRVVLNLGGIANITCLPAAGVTPLAYDTGPANGLMDAWIQRIHGDAYDNNGNWAQSASADIGLLKYLLDEPYFGQPAPKSTGKELFHLRWAEQKAPLDQYNTAVVQATFLALSVESIARAIESHGQCKRILACGGGVHNSALIQALSDRLGVAVESTSTAGIEPDWLEAMAFAWMARCHINGTALDTRPFTGATKPSILGSLIPGGRQPNLDRE